MDRLSLGSAFARLAPSPSNAAKTELKLFDPARRSFCPLQAAASSNLAALCLSRCLLIQSFTVLVGPRLESNLDTLVPASITFLTSHLSPLGPAHRNLSYCCLFTHPSFSTAAAAIRAQLTIELALP